MAKTKKTKPPQRPVNDPPLDDKTGQLRVIKQNSETYTKHTAECFTCMEKDSDRDVTLDEYARGLFDEGWRVVLSEKFQTIGLMCPKCVETPDKDRGE